MYTDGDTTRFLNEWLVDSSHRDTQARHQDLAAGGTKNQKEGPKTRGGAHF